MDIPKLLDDSSINRIKLFLDRVGRWFPIRESLASIIVNRKFGKTLEVGVFGVERKGFYEKAESIGVEAADAPDGCIDAVIRGGKVRIHLYTDCGNGSYVCGNETVGSDILWCSQEDASEIRKKHNTMSGSGVWTIPYTNELPVSIPIPYMAGSLLDIQMPLWFTKTVHSGADFFIRDVFFDEKRCEEGYRLLKKMYDCAGRAGISDVMWIGFGTALGYLRHGNFVPNDRDMDMCFNSDLITKEQQFAYSDLLYESSKEKPHRWRGPQVRDDNGKILWFSYGDKHPDKEHGVKSCQWFFYNWNGYSWHTKGGMWVDHNKFNPSNVEYTQGDAAISKGIPEVLVNKLVKTTWNGIEIMVPERLGGCCDHWYPGWCNPDKGASAHEHVMVVGNWNDKKTWRCA